MLESQAAAAALAVSIGQQAASCACPTSPSLPAHHFARRTWAAALLPPADLPLACSHLIIPCSAYLNKPENYPLTSTAAPDDAKVQKAAALGGSRCTHAEALPTTLLPLQAAQLSATIAEYAIVQTAWAALPGRGTSHLLDTNLSPSSTRQCSFHPAPPQVQSVIAGLPAGLPKPGCCAAVQKVGYCLRRGVDMWSAARGSNLSGSGCTA